MYKTVLSMLRMLDQKLSRSLTEFVTAEPFWTEVSDSCKKLVYMMSGLAQTYGTGELEQSVISNLQQLQRLIQNQRSLISGAGVEPQRGRTSFW